MSHRHEPGCQAYLDRTIRESAASESLGKTPGQHRTICRSAASELSGKTLGPSRIEFCAEVPRASRQARRWVHLEPSAEAIHKGAVWQAASPVSKHAQPREPPCTPCRPPSNLSSKPLPRSRMRPWAQAATADSEPNPLDYSL